MFVYPHLFAYMQAIVEPVCIATPRTARTHAPAHHQTHHFAPHDAVTHGLPPEERHLVAALADDGGGVSTPQSPQPLLPHHSGGCVDGSLVLEQCSVCALWTE